MSHRDGHTKRGRGHVTTEIGMMHELRDAKDSECPAEHQLWFSVPGEDPCSMEESKAHHSTSHLG